jgi:hypothetical protein
MPGGRLVGWLQLLDRSQGQQRRALRRGHTGQTAMSTRS